MVQNTDARESPWSKIFKDIRDKALVFAILIAIGFILASGFAPLPALGIPAYSFVWLGAAFVLYAFFYLLPSPSKIMASCERRMWWVCSNCGLKLGYYTPFCPSCGVVLPTQTITETTIESEHIGLIITRSTLKILIILFIIIQLYLIFSNYLLIPTILMFAIYFTLPTRYKTNQPYKAIESWFRMVLGVLMGITLMLFFVKVTIDFVPVLIGIFTVFGIIAVVYLIAKSRVSGYGVWLVAGLIFIVLGIFGALSSLFVVPQLSLFLLTVAYFCTMPVIEREEREKIIIVGLFEKLSKAGERLYKKQDAFGKALFVTLVIAAMIPVISWISTNGAAAGIFLAIFFLSILTGTLSRESRPYIGSVVLLFAIFAFSLAYTETVGTAVFGPYWGSVQTTAQMFFGPISEQLERGSCEAYATWLCISEGPVRCAEEKLKCQRIKATPVGSELALEFRNFKTDPPQYYIDGENIIYFELENAGDYDAEDINVKIDKNNGWITRINAKEYEKAIGTVIMDDSSCIAGEYQGQNTCFWQGKLPKGGKVGVLFNIKWTEATEEDTGKYPKIRITAWYDYHVRSSYTVDVRSSEELRRLMMAGEQIAGTLAQFSGGPITASIWTPKYIESGKATLVTASLTNTKLGEALSPYYCIYVPRDADISDLSEFARMESTGCPQKPDTHVIKCSWDKIPNVKTVDKYAKPLNTKSCHFRLKIDIGAARQKQLPIFGEAFYTYEIKYEKKDIMFAFVSEV